MTNHDEQPDLETKSVQPEYATSRTDVADEPNPDGGDQGDGGQGDGGQGDEPQSDGEQGETEQDGQDQPAESGGYRPELGAAQDAPSGSYIH